MSTSQLPITAIIPVRNEEANIEKCLKSVQFCSRVIVLDSASDDLTCEKAKSLDAEVIQFQYSGSYPKKRQWAMQHLSIATPWILLLDADEQVTRELELAIRDATSNEAAPTAFVIEKGFHFLGQKFRFGGFSHSAVLLFQTGKARFEKINLEETSGMDMEVHERLIVDGTVGKLKHPLIHDDFKGLQAYIDRHNRYSSWEAAIRLRDLGYGTKANDEQIKPSLFGDVQQRRRFLKKIAIRIPGEPWLWFFYHYFVRLGFLEGKRGLIASQIRANYIRNVRAKMFERSIKQPTQINE